MNPFIRLLLIEDSPSDAAMINHVLKNGGYDPKTTRVETRQQIQEALVTQQFDTIICDYFLPLLRAPEALASVQEFDLDLPFIVVSGSMNVELAVSMMRAGAQDYLMKDDLARLIPAIERELREVQVRKEGKILKQQLEKERNLLHSLLSYSPDLIAFKDLECRFTHISKSYADKLMLNDPKKAQGRLESDYFDQTYAPATEIIDQVILITGEAEVGLEEKVTWPDGHTVWMSTTKMPLIDNDNRIVGLIGVSRDIDKRKKIEQELEEAHLFAQATIDAIPDHICVIDEKGMILSVNQSWMNFAKANPPFDPLFWIGANYIQVCDLAAQSDRLSEGAAFGDALRQVIDGTIDSFEIEYPCHEPGGEKRWFNARIRRFTWSGPVRIAISHVDITLRKMAEEAAKENENRYRAVTETANDAIITANAIGCVVSWNQGAENIFGWQADEIMGQPLKRLIPGAYYGIHRSGLKRVVEGGEQHIIGKTTEMEAVRKDQKTIPIEISLAEWEMKEEKFYSAIIRDISRRKKTDEFLYLQSAALEAAVNAIVITDRDGSIEWCNQAFHTLTGYAIEEVVGQNPRMLKSGMQDTAFYAAMWSTVLSGQVWRGEIINRRKDGSFYTEEMTITPLFDVKGEIDHFIAIKHDVSEKIQTHRMMEIRTEMMEFAPTHPLEEVLPFCLDKICGFFNSPVGYFYYVSPDQATVKLQAWSTWAGNDLHGVETTVSQRPTHQDGVWSDALRLKKPVVYNDFCSPPNRQGFPEEDAGIIREMVVPITRNDLVVAIFEIGNKPVVYDQHDLDAANILADIVWTIAQHKIAEDEVNREAVWRKDLQVLLQQEKELLSLSLLSISEGVISTDADGIINIFNSSAEQITGYTQPQAVDHPLHEVFHLVDRKNDTTLSNPIEELLNIEKLPDHHRPNQSSTLLTQDRRKITIAGSIAPIRSGNDVTRGYIIVFSDVTERNRRAETSSLSQKLEAIGQLSAGIAHEINTPIQYVTDNTHFLKKAFERINEYLVETKTLTDQFQGNTPPAGFLNTLYAVARDKKVDYYLSEAPLAINETLAGVERVRKIIVAIREFSHPSAKEKRFADINKAIMTTVTISRNEWKYVADLTTDLDPNIPPVYCQIDEINQVILNMIVNAAQAIQMKVDQSQRPKGSIHIRDTYAEDCVRIYIQDTGSGIPEAIRSRIFDPFFTTKPVGKGTGQGLAIAHNIVTQKHNGTIDVISEVGVGSTFIITLPVSQAEEEEAIYEQETQDSIRR